MAKKRTKKSKARARKRRSSVTKKMKGVEKKESRSGVVYQFDDKAATKVLKSGKRAKDVEVDESLVSYDAKLLRGDLMKTVLLSCLVFGVEMGLWMYLK